MLGQAEKSQVNNHPTMSKPPYRVPSMEEIREIKHNGYSVASTFSGTGGSCLGYRMAGFRVLWANEFIPAAQECYKANHPNSILDTRDIRLIKPEEILEAIALQKGELDLFDGSPPCFAAGTPVITKRGVIPIEQVQIGDEVITHKGRWRKVVDTMQRISPTVLIDRRLETTLDHRFYARQSLNNRSVSRCLGVPEWIEAQNLDKAFLGLPISIEATDIEPAPQGFSYSDSFWYFVGRWLGDGWLRIEEGEDKPYAHRARYISYQIPCLNCEEPSRAHSRYTGWFTSYCSEPCRLAYKRKSRKRPKYEIFVCSSFDEADSLHLKMLELNTTIGRATERTTERFRISSKALALWLVKYFGRYASGKYLPGFVYSMPQTWRQSLLQGYLDADRHKDDHKYKATSVGRCLIAGLILLSNTIGYTHAITPRINVNSVIEGRECNVKQSYIFQLTPDDGRYTTVIDNIRWRKLRRLVLPCSDLTTVYDITVEEDSSFIADTFIVHNCASFSTAGKREAGWGKVKQYSDTKQRTDDLFFEYTRLLKGLKPKVFVAENVSGLIKGTAKGYFLEILKALKDCGYNVKCKVLDAQWLGVPQARQRTIFIGVRQDLGLEPIHPMPLPYRYTVRDALPWITKIEMGKGFREVEVIPSEASPYQTVGTSLTSGNGLATNIEAETDISRYAIGREWDNIKQGEKSDKYLNLTKPSLDKPCPTVTQAGGNITTASVVHPTEKRKFTIPELKRICAFPDDFILTGSYAQQWERLGRAVPPVMMKAIASTIRDEILAKCVE